MPCMLDVFGMRELAEDEELFEGVLRLCVANGYPLDGYRGAYTCFDCGNMSFMVRARRGKGEDAPYEVCGVDTQLTGNAIWHVRVVACEEGDPEDYACRCLVEAAEEGKGGVAVVNIVCADILPSYAPGTLLDLQMCALPLDFRYYDSEDDYIADPTSHLALPKPVRELEGRRGKDGAHFAILGEGTVCPIGLFAEPDKGKSRGVTYLRGTVKHVRMGDTIERRDAFYIVTLDTQFGPLEVAHAADGLSEAERGRIHEGATLALSCLLSGDAHLGRYEIGLIRDEDTHLRLLMGVFAKDDPERLRAVSEPGLRYLSAYNKREWAGLEAVLERLRYVHQTTKWEYRGRLGTVVGVRQPPHQPRLPYGVGRRCVRLYAETEEGEQDLGTLFVTMGKKGALAAFDVTDSEPYTVALDPPEERNARRHVWPAPPPSGSQAQARALFAFAREHITACAKAAEAAGKAPRGGLVWLKEDWEWPDDFVPLVFAFNGETYAVDVSLYEYNRYPDFLPGISSVGNREPIARNGLASRCLVARAGREGEPPFVAHTKHNAWALYGYGDEEDAPPPDEIDVPPRPASPWECDRLAILEARRFLERNGLACLSVCGAPDVGPQIWFRDAQGRACWMRTAFATTAEECDAKRLRGLEQAVPRFRANDGYCLIVHLPGFGVPPRGVLPALVAEPLQRLYVAP